MDAPFNLSHTGASEGRRNKCMCHIRPGVIILSNSDPQFTSRTWQSFRIAAEARIDSVAAEMEAEWETGPKGGYHKQCYMNYINKDHIKRWKLKRKQTEVSANETTTFQDQPSTSMSPPSRLKSRSQSQMLVKDKCIICQKEKAIGKGKSRKKEKLVQCCTMNANDSLKRAASENNDETLLLQIQGRDLIADEVKYHHSCYNAFTRSKKRKVSFVETNKGEGFNKAFATLAKELQEKILRSLKVMSMRDVCARYVYLLNQEGVDGTGYRSEKLKAKIQKHFGQTLSFHQLKNKAHSEIIFSSAVSTGEIVERAIKMAEAAETEGDWDFDEESQASSSSSTHFDTYCCATSIRKLLMQITPILPFPPSADDFDLDKMEDFVPEVLYNMLAWIICGNGQHSEYSNGAKAKVSPKVHRQVMSIAQDLIHCTRNGTIQTPKHVSLPITLKSITGSSEVVTILNRLGHGLSYSKIEEIETAMAEEQLAKYSEGTFLPSTCQENVPGVFCWDNNDIQEETLSGKGTTHCTNGIVIQRKVHGCNRKPDTSTPLEPPTRSKRRTLTPTPGDIIPYIPHKRKPPPAMEIDDGDLRHPDMANHRPAQIKDFGWFLARLPRGDVIQKVPAWTAFNVVMSENDIPRQSIVGYCQTIEASPTQLPTVYTLLHRSMSMANQLNQTDCIIVCDQAIYCKALEIIWRNTELFKRVVLRMGAFHMSCAFLAVIGKRFGEAGLSDVLVESGIIGSGSIAGVLEGRHYNRAVRIHKIMMEALLRLRWESYVKEFDGQLVDSEDIESLVGQIDKVCNVDTIHNLLRSPAVDALFSKIEEYASRPEGPMKEFWNSYIEMTGLLLRFIRATREGDWVLHLACVRDMLPWYFAYDRINYARYASVYWVQMMNLHDTHPEAYEMLSKGDMSVQRNALRGFSQVAVDQTIEQTMNRNSKTKGGIVGFSLRPGAVQRWITTAHSRSAIVDKCREMAGLTNASSACKETTTPRMQRDERDVCDVKDTISILQNPFHSSDSILSLASGVVADESTQADLLQAKEKGCEKMINFVNERLVDQTKDFFATLPKMKLKTFAKVKSTAKVDGKDIMLVADRNLFARLLVIAQTRKMDIRSVLSYELGPVPWALSNASGKLTKTNKAKLPKLLETEECHVSERPNATACIIDAMGVIQGLTRIPSTFQQLAEQLLEYLLRYCGKATRVDFVGDTYPPVSIKTAERKARASTGTVRMDIKRGSQKTPKQWKKYLAVGSNKESLLQFLQKEWASNAYARKLQGKFMFVTSGNSCWKIFPENKDTMRSEDVPLLSCTHEEADTRMFLHAKHASEGHDVILIKSSDTDVEVIALHHFSNIEARMFLHSGTYGKDRLIDVTVLANQLGPAICNALPGLHALTGCDTVSAFTGKGKQKALELLQKDSEWCTVFQKLGQTLPPEEHTFVSIEKFVCALYTKSNTNLDDVNAVRYKIFCKASNAQSHMLPPTRDALRKHISRANYQSAIWRGSLDKDPVAIGPEGQGWKVSEGQLLVDWTSQQPAPVAILKLMSCQCKSVCRTLQCSCRKNGLSCTDCCKCDDNDCENRTERLEDGVDDEDMEGDELDTDEEAD